MRLAVLCDSPDEKWPSMDLVGQMLAAQLQRRKIPHHVFAPPIARRTGNFALDRLLLRFLEYPSQLRGLGPDFDLFHIVDHSYSQLVHHLPAGRTVVTCHDLDTFRSVLEPSRIDRGAAFRLMTRRILSGFRKAGHVACDSLATLNEILQFNLLPPERLSVVPLGVHPSCSAEPNEVFDPEADRLLGGSRGPDILHVGSTLPRKRIDVLLRVFAQVRERYPATRLIRVGGPLNVPQREIARDLHVEDGLLELPFLERGVLAAVYRKVALVMQPSDAEGFGLPVAEAMACGTPVIASDLPVLREVGGNAATYCPPGDIESWAGQVIHMLEAAREDPRGAEARRARSISQAAAFSWEHYTQRMIDVYNGLLIQLGGKTQIKDHHSSRC